MGGAAGGSGDKTREAGGFAVETRGLTKRYGLEAAVEGLSLRVPRGTVYGFLGPNGAGKTTTMRMLLGLAKPTSGSVRVLGRDPAAPGGLSGVGAMVGPAGFYPYLSGRANLEVLARHAGGAAFGADELLGRVGLKGRGGDKVKGYSVGMRRRLGVAAALLKNPELLVLDEPTTGLDAAGMAAMRTLVRGLGDEGRTVLISSHLMREVEQTCDRVCVIDGGRAVGEGTLGELRRLGGLEVRAEPLGRAREAAAVLPGVREALVSGGGLWLSAEPERAPEVVRGLVEAGVRVSEVRPAGLSLEEVFLRLTGEGGEQ